MSYRPRAPRSGIGRKANARGRRQHLVVSFLSISEPIGMSYRPRAPRSGIGRKANARPARPVPTFSIRPAFGSAFA